MAIGFFAYDGLGNTLKKWSYGDSYWQTIKMEVWFALLKQAENH